MCLGLILSACGSTPTQRLVAATPVLPTALVVTPTASVTPSATPRQATATALAPPTVPPGVVRLTLHGNIYDAARGSERPLTDASLEWQFAALDWQDYNGQLSVSDGNYRLSLIVRPDDELFITARAPGYRPNTTRLQAAQLGRSGARLNFGLLRADEPLPTVPGSLGAVKLSGIVYNLARGPAAPIEHASITLVNNSVVEPIKHHQTFSTATGAFSITLDLHGTDRLEITIAASDYLSTTFTRSGKDLAQNPRVNIGLRPAPKTQ